MKQYDHRKIEKKWQRVWDDEGLYQTSENKNQRKCFVLDMFPYPSGEGLHVGHPKGYIASDIYARFERMSGKSVLHPMGWDAFGLPAENYALKHKVHPRIAVEKNIARYKSQLSQLGLSYDWSREINTTDPSYYRWTQWIFLKLFEKGLAYQSNEPINWCPSCKTGLANEDLEGNTCERCGSVVEKRSLPQWVLRITDYAERLLDDLAQLHWPESIKESQRNWIGKSEGMLFSAPVKGSDLVIQTFSAHFEAFCADTFVVIAPDHPLLEKLVAKSSNKDEILTYAKQLVVKRSQSREAVQPEGMFTGAYIVDPVGNGDLPIWIANYALADYGTGIVKASCHDERDFAFAKKYDIPLKPVLFPRDEEERKKVASLEVCFTDMKEGVLDEPAQFKGKQAGSVRADIINYLIRQKIAEKKTVYRLRDWVFSRQRYWGEPIPIIHCESCGAVPVPEKDLPVVLPDVSSYEPTGTGESPLAGIPSWVNTTCPSCGGRGRRETNTMPQWAGSSWYYLRYMDPHNHDALVSSDREKYWDPVDLYVGGAEHATRHLIYARFWHKVLFDIGVVHTPEPFSRLQHVGLILASDGKKMSKRYGNVVNPDEVVDTYGADTLRVYEMFMGPFDQNTAWSTESIIGARRFVEKVWRIGNLSITESLDPKLDSLLHQSIKKVGEDIQQFRFNTAISTLMILCNEIERSKVVSLEGKRVLFRLVAPFMPYLAEELWHTHGGEKTSVHTAPWPSFDEGKFLTDEMMIVVQVNGRTRASFTVPLKEDKQKIIDAAKAIPEIKRRIHGLEIQREIYVPERLVNIVVEEKKRVS